MNKRACVIRKRREIYDKMCILLTDYEHREDIYEDINWEEELYDMLVEIQNNWEAVITVQEG